MRGKLLAVIIVLSQGIQADQSGAPTTNPAAINERVLRTNAALKSYNEEYLPKPQHKAFAQSPEGAWS